MHHVANGLEGINERDFTRGRGRQGEAVEIPPARDVPVERIAGDRAPRRGTDVARRPDGAGPLRTESPVRAVQAERGRQISHSGVEEGLERIVKVVGGTARWVILESCTLLQPPAYRIG